MSDTLPPIVWEEVKDPDDILDYDADWALWLKTDTIATSTWPVVPSGITKVSDTHTDTAAVIKVSGGAAGQAYLLTNRIVTAAGRQKDRTFKLTVKNN